MNDRPTFVLVLRPLPGVDGLRAIRALIKIALRKFGLRCVMLREEQAKDIAAARLGKMSASGGKADMAYCICPLLTQSGHAPA
jgi:hypothetical protein